jgi:hypothetical protein
MPPLSTRDIVHELLRTYQDVACTLNAAGEWIGRGPGSRYLDRPPNHDYHQGSYRELEDVLRTMRKLLPTAYAVIAETYIRCERRIVEEPVKRKAKNNRTVTLIERRSVPVGTKKDPRLIEAGVRWIAAEFERRGVVPQLPLTIYEAVSA